MALSLLVGWQAAENQLTIVFGIHRSPTLLPRIGHTQTVLRALAMVVAQHAAEALPALDIANLPTDLVARIDDPVPQAWWLRSPW